MNLVIVESPTKAKTLTHFLGADYKVLASMGHVRDLPQNRLGIDVNHDFAPYYQVMPDHKKIINELKEEGKKAEKIILATDPDREGEAIAWHVAQVLRLDARNWKLDKEAGSLKIEQNLTSSIQPQDLTSSFQRPASISRIVFHEITQSAIKEALAHPRALDMQLVDAQQGRRILDRLVGYKLSPVLWAKVRRGLSAGRVQSVCLRIICEREREIEKFKSEEYWTIVLKAVSGQDTSGVTAAAGSPEVEVSGQTVDFELISKDSVKYETSQTFDLYDGKYTVTKTTILTREQALEIIKDIERYSVYISDIEKKAVKRFPLPPFTTSTLQQEAGRKLGYSAKKTMQLAQRLYENGLITYHRTDSVNLAWEAVDKCRKFIVKEFGQEYLPDKPRFFHTKQKLAQEAHEGIRPTNVDNGKWIMDKGKEEGKWELGREEERLYNLIWKRFVACQMREAQMERTTVWAQGGVYLFKTSGSLITFPGFLKVYPEALEEETRLPIFEKGEELQKEEILPIQHFTAAPPRYSEANLIATLEEKGIGRPSTYAPIISTILERHYVEKDPPASGRGAKLKPTNLGVAVNDFLVANFSSIDDIPFTAQMEDELDEIAQGQRKWVVVIKDFFAPFSQTLQSVYKNSEKVKVKVEETDQKCDLCGSTLVIRIGRFGKFLACSKFPECKFTKNLVLTTGLKCPQDGAEVVIKRTKRGKTFYGCANYPKCKWASWTKPKPTPGVE